MTPRPTGAALMLCTCGHDETSHVANVMPRFCTAFGCGCPSLDQRPPLELGPTTPAPFVRTDPALAQQLERVERKLDWVAHALLYLTPFVRPGITDPEALMPYPPAGPKGTE